ncbi:MAG: DUF3622 domain-containing protein [Gammaproteobacteria bacterium]|nr:DUF3622 domain-containing protein [Gammaproteobacteria bacterium]
MIKSAPDRHAWGDDLGMRLPDQIQSDEIELMAKSKKYECVVSEENGSWRADIVRKVSRTKVLVTMSKDGFSDDDDAMDWGKKEISVLLKAQNAKERQKRREKAEAKEWVEQSNIDKAKAKTKR